MPNTVAGPRGLLFPFRSLSISPPVPHAPECFPAGCCGDSTVHIPHTRLAPDSYPTPYHSAASNIIKNGPKWAYILTSFYFTVVKTKIFFFFISFVKATAWLRLHLSNKPSYGMAGKYKCANSYTPIPDQTCETAVSMYSSTHVWPRPSSNWLPTYLSSIGAL